MKDRSRLILIVAGLLIFSMIVRYLYNYAVDSPFRIEAAEAKRRIENKGFDVILDVRTDLERRTLGSYPGSVHVQSADIETKFVPNYAKDTRVLIYCNTGHRARMAADKLHRLGYKNTVYISSQYNSLL
jgi:rhodanese-related sulfurtransferase